MFIFLIFLFIVPNNVILGEINIRRNISSYEKGNLFLSWLPYPSFPTIYIEDPYNFIDNRFITKKQMKILLDIEII